MFKSTDCVPTELPSYNASVEALVARLKGFQPLHWQNIRRLWYRGGSTVNPYYIGMNGLRSIRFCQLQVPEIALTNAHCSTAN